MRFVEKTTVQKFQTKPLRGKYLNAPKVYRTVVHLRMSPFDSRMCSTMNL